MSAKTEFNSKGKNTKREAPFSLRLSFEERAQLEASANGVPLDVSPSDIDAARQNCPWPGGVN